jgi:acetyl coenzyme A synthetase (ADP forming)-like protein
MVMPAVDYRADAILQDGSSIQIRALRNEDSARLLELFHHLSQRSVYFKFFRPKPWLSEGELALWIDLDFLERVALAAVHQEDRFERVIGVGRYLAIPAGTSQRRRAEVALLVAEEHQGRGVGTLLLEHLVKIGRSQGISEFEADVLEENSQMMRVFADSGFPFTQSSDGGITHVRFSIAETEDSTEAQLSRERHAAAQSIRAFLHPRSVAVLGASRQANSIGAALVTNIRGSGFTGGVYPVNPKADEIGGLKAYPSLSAIGAPVDLALIAVPAPFVEQSLRDCASAGVRGAVVISSGFGEVSAEGRMQEKSLRDLARHAGMRMVGPNCMGLLNTDPACSLNATFVPSWPPAGNIGMLSQSGALGYVILEHMQCLNIGLSTFVSVGNKADVSGNDLLCYWAEDPATKVIVLYLESFGNPRRFARIAPEVARLKPIVAVKAGRSAAGTRAASSHSAALASLDVAVDALFEQAGVIRTDTLEELMDVAILLSSQPIPAGPRVGLITNGGGPGILLADACEARGLKVPEFSPETVSRLRDILPSQASLANPVDMIASAKADHYAAAIKMAGADPNVDSLIVIYIPPRLHPPEEVAQAIAEAAGEVPMDKPVLTVFTSWRGAPPMLSNGPRGRLPSYSFPENAARALAAAEKYGRWRTRSRGSILALEAKAKAAIRTVIDRALHERTGPFWLEPAELTAVLEAAGIEVAAAEQTSFTEAPEVAERMGYPLVLKIQSKGVVHKSDIGGVILGLNSRDEVVAALGELEKRMRRMGVPLDRVLLQREICAGIEALVGVTTDPTFGPLLVCGLGGVLVEVLKDVSFRLTPVSDDDSEEMVSRLRSAVLLDGYRGAPAGDRPALTRLIQRVSAMVELIPELRELDLNPVKVLEPGSGAVVVDGRMRIGRL